MKQASLKMRLAAFLERHYPNWIASGEIQRIVVMKTTYTGRTVARRLGELAQAGILETKYGNKHHVWYRFKKTEENELKPFKQESFNL